MPYPIFVMEGPDGSGKTTLAKTLQTKLNARYLHCTYRFKGRMKQYHWATLRLALKLAQTRPVVIDRWWPSEICYSNTYRNGPEPGYNYKELHAVAKAYGVTYTFCCPTRWEHYWEFYQNHYTKDKEMYPLSEPQINLLWRNYRDLMLRDYFEFERDLLHYYSVVLDAYRCDFFADYIISRYKSWAGQRDQGQKEAIRELSANWRDVGRHEMAPELQTRLKPMQGKLL